MHERATALDYYVPPAFFQNIAIRTVQRRQKVKSTEATRQTLVVGVSNLLLAVGHS